jgi:hypothetical protein
MGVVLELVGASFGGAVVLVAGARLPRIAAAREQRLVVLAAAAGHGWDLVGVPAFERTLTSFLVRHGAR